MSSVDRKPPSVLAVFIAATLSVTIGVLLAAVHLASQPVEVMKVAPKEAPAAGKLYYVLGASGSTAGKTWDPKEKALSEGHAGVVSLSEAELNAWAEGTLQVAKVSADEKGQSVMILAGVPNFRVEGTDLHVGLVNTVTVFGSEAPLVLQARGKFEKGSAGWHYVASEATLGALPLHKIPALLSLVADRFGATQLPAVVDKVLRDARDIAVRDGALVITSP